MARLVVDGEAGHVVANLTATMCDYLSEPGFDGFLAWLDQRANQCNCGERHVPDAQAVRGNLRNLKAAMDKALREVGCS